MTNDERIELLKKVAECAPKEMGALFYDDKYDGTAHVWFERLGIGPYLLDDIQDATAIIAMLEAMEMDWHTSLESVRDVKTGKVSYIALVYPLDMQAPGNHKFFAEGSTRAEAVSKVFVKVFGEKP